MLSLEFFEQNLHFAISLFTALVFFAVFWLYFDAWAAESHKSAKDAFKWLGFLLVSLSFVVYATIIEQSNLGQSIFGDTASIIASTLRLIGFAAIIVGQIIDPLQQRPVTNGLADDFGLSEHPNPSKKHRKKSSLKAVFATSSGFGIIYTLPFGAAAIAALYWRRATTGIERHLKPVAYAFAFLFGFELLSLGALFRGTDNPTLYSTVAAFGPLWIASHACLLLATLILGRWVWHYLTERFLSQLFMMFTTTILAIFLLTTVSFTFLLLHSIQNDSLNNLETAANVLGYALDSKEAETQANTEAVAENPAIVQAIVNKDHNALVNLTSTFLEDKKQSSLVITTADAQVLLRAEDPEHWGDSISSDTLVRRALIGSNSESIATDPGVLSPTVSIRSIVPARDSAGNIVGTISASMVIDNTFVDGIKHATGLDSSVYSGNVRSATTLTAPDGTTRWVGVKETNQPVLSAVLQNGKTFKGALSILNRQYLAVYVPLKDVDNTVVGMLFIGQPETYILQTTAHLISLTFIVSVILLAFAIIPAFLLARHIAKQLE